MDSRRFFTARIALSFALAASPSAWADPAAQPSTPPVHRAKSTSQLAPVVVAAAAPAPGPDKNIVFSLDGILVTQVPYETVKPKPNQAPPSGTFFEVDRHTFRISDHAVKMIQTLLADPKVHISFFSGRPQKETEDILNFIKLDSSKSLKDVATKILGKEDLTDKDPKIPEPDVPHDLLSNKYTKDLTKIVPNGRNVVLVDNDPQITDAAHLLDVGKDLYFFDKFTDAQSEVGYLQKAQDKIKAAKKDKYDPTVFQESLTHIPADEASWYANRNRADRIYWVLNKSVDDSNHNGASLESAVHKYAQADPLKAISEGQVDLTKFVDWAIDSSQNKVVGCTEKSSADPKYTKSVTLSRCQSELKIANGWENPRSNKCVQITDSGAYIAGAKLDDCVQGGKVLYEWINEAAGTCGQYTDSKVFIANADKALCDDPVEKDLKPCLQETTQTYRFYHHTSPEKIAVRQDTGAGALEAKRWGEYYWKDGNTYNGLWTARDPAATVSYGNILYRVEIPKGTRYYDMKAISACSFSPESKKELEAAGCPADLGFSFLTKGATIPTCRPLAHKVFDHLKIRAYTIGGYTSGLQGCQPYNQSLVWLNIGDLPDRSFAKFGPTAPPPGDPDRAEAESIQSLFKDIGSSLWNDVVPQPGAADQAKKYIMGCEAFGSVADPAPKAAVATLPQAPCSEPSAQPEQVVAMHAQVKKIISHLPKKSQ